MPKVGDAFRMDNIYVKVLEVDTHRVENVLVCVLDFEVEEE
jgi:CBS domain containing-hemolysin-like protein